MEANLSGIVKICNNRLVFSRVFIIFTLYALIWSGAPRHVEAAQNSANDAQIIRAFKAIDQRRWDEGRALIAQTKDPLGAKLYYWLSFTRKYGEPNYLRLTQFIRGNPSWPEISSLKRQAEEVMPDTLTPSEVLAWFDDYPPKTTGGIDRYLRALISSGRSDKARTYLSDWWAQTPLSREGQRNIFREYSRYITREAHGKRFDVLLFKKQYDNARAIANILGNGYPQLAQARIALAEQKPNVNALIAKVPATLQRDPGLLYERLRWRRRNDLNNEAVQILNNPPPAAHIHNQKDWWRERHIIIRRLTEQRKYKGAYVLASKHRQTSGFSYAQAEWLAGWLALSFLNDAPKALQHFEALHAKVNAPISKARAAYWAGKAAKTLGHQGMTQRFLGEAAQYQTTFYGQTAGAQLGLDSALPYAAPPIIDAVTSANFQADPFVRAARLFKKAGMRKNSSAFIQGFVKKEKTAQAYKFAAEMAADLEQYHDAVRIAKNATTQGLFLTAQAYPVIADKLGKVNVEWALVHAVIRQESVFDYEARSHAGALGLMQLLPGTAKDVARSLGIAHRTDWLTSRPDHNITLGSQYLNDMLVRYGGSYPLAIAAYNAGPGRVDRWLKTFGDPRLGDVDMIDWIELMPIYETRNYVQRVMEAVYVYRLRLRNIQKKPQGAIHVAMRYRT